MEMLINQIEKLKVLDFQYDFTIKCYLLDTHFHVMIMTMIDALRLNLEDMIHRIQTM